MEVTSWNSSYVYGNDNYSGWGERFFFAYFSEFGKRPIPIITVEVTIFVIIFIVSVLANASIVICVFRYPDMRTVTNTFVLNLAAADLLFAFTIPPVAYTRVVVAWLLGDIACRLIPYIQFVSGIVLLWTLAMISMDRHRCIVIPPYRSKMSPKQATLSCTVIWISTIIVFIPVTLWFREVKGIDDKTVCTLIFPKSESINYSVCFVVPVILIACLLPMVMLVFHYHKIFQKIISTKNTWASSCVMVSTMEIKGCSRASIRRQSELSLSDIFVPWPRKYSQQISTSPNGGRQGSLSQHEEIRINKHIKVVRILFLNVILVLLMWLPITLVMLLIYIDGRRPTTDTGFFLRSHHFILALIIAFLNTLVNPVLYGVLSDNFRACLIRMWCGRNNGKINFVKDQVTPSSGRMNGNVATKTMRKQSFINSVSENQNGIV